MSQYNKTVLTHAGLELAKRANAGQAKFGITRAVTSADDWSNKTVQDLEEVTAIPNIMQQGTIMDTDEVESNNSVIGVSLCFTNKNLSTGYQIRIIGLYVKEEGQENDFLYAVTTAITPEYMPSFADKVLYRFNTQMYLVIGNAQSVNVVINDGTAVTHGQFNKYKAEVTGNLKTLENTHKEDMSHVAKSASINGGAEILPDNTGKLNLVVPDPDLSKYVSLEQLTEMLQGKADITAVPDKTDTEEGIRQAKAAAKAADDKAQSALDSKADKTDVYTKKAVDDAFSTRDSKIDGAVNLANQAQATANTKANASDVYTKSEVDSKTSGTVVTAYDIASKSITKETNSYTNKWLVDQSALSSFADQINQLKGRRTADAPDFNTLTDSGVYLISSPRNGKNFPTSSWGALVVFNGSDGTRVAQLFVADNGTEAYVRTYGWINDANNWGNWNQIAWKSDISNLQNKLAQYTVDYNNNYVHDTTIDFNSYLHETRTIKVANVKANNGPLANTATLWGWLTTYHWDDNSVTQEYRDAGGEVFWRATSASASRPWTWHKYATDNDITDLQNQIQQLRDNQFEVQTFTDATAAANWESQRPGKRMAIVNS